MKESLDESHQNQSGSEDREMDIDEDQQSLNERSDRQQRADDHDSKLYIVVNQQNRAEKEDCTKSLYNAHCSLKLELSHLESYLNKKRTISPKSREDMYQPITEAKINFLTMFYYSHEQHEHQHKTSNSSISERPKGNHNNYQYLHSSLNKYVFGSKKETSDIKRIGIIAEDIFCIPKYKIDMNNLPKYGRITDRLTAEYGESKPDNKIKKKMQSYSYIDLQNKEALEQMEKDRIKHRNLPKASKDKLDNNNLRKQWNWISKKEIPKVQKMSQKTKSDNEYNAKRLVNLIQKEIKKKVNKVQRAQKETNLRAKKLQKEMVVFWRKRDKEIVDIQKKREKTEIDQKKKEEELKEQINKKKRMEYLLKQSDIYSHMMYKHLGAFMPQEQEENKPNEEVTPVPNPILQQAKPAIIAGNEVLLHHKTNKILFQSIRVDIDEKKAAEDAKVVINKQRQRASQFDEHFNKVRRTLGGEEVAMKPFEDINKSNQENPDDMQIDCLDQPMINNSSSQLIEAPKNFGGDLKEYQLKGLRWLDNLYEQGINGILADEMGLGKTIQAIAFLAHLAEEKHNWGPFLVIAPNATLYNWQQEFNRFFPSLKVLPYWGGIKERKTLRKFFNSSQLYVKSSAFHVCITSYQLVVTDEKTFHKVDWNYMILDEAQAIKNIASQRWITLLSFNCRNRLLLTGTPIQNSMSELWALLHFIMPNIFDSHDQFQEWFSKDIEAHSQEKGELNQEQLKRLHKILKPFMLRRVKKDVEHEIGPKVEYEIPCEMTEKQRILYNSIKEKLSNISDLFMSTDSKVKVDNLMNLVMQFRKVCNHPELFERNIGKVPFTFRELINEPKSTYIYLNGDVQLRTISSPLIQYVMPKIVYDLLYNTYQLSFIPKHLSLYSKENIYSKTSKLFNWVSMAPFVNIDMEQVFTGDMLFNQIALMHYVSQVGTKTAFYTRKEYKEYQPFSLLISRDLFIDDNDYKVDSTKGCIEPLIRNTILSRKTTVLKKVLKHRFYIPKVISFMPGFVCSSSMHTLEQQYERNNLLMNKVLYGSEFNQFGGPIKIKALKTLKETINEDGLMTDLFYGCEGYTPIELPSFERLISDCAKLKRLDELLETLYKGNHRVLIFCQMTKMIDILEEYMTKKKYSYFRMDGRTEIADRRDMINEFQTNPKVFSFLLSTRAGGLGVNLTGADTVIFYDNDWNPTMDAQATDRAHRIGQTKVVSVYRLITAGTIEERILKRAKQKQNVQTTVYSGGAFKAEIFKQNDIVELLYSEEEMQKMEQEKKRLLVEINTTSTDKKMVDMNSKSKNNKKKKEKKIIIKKKGKEVGEASEENNSMTNSQSPTNNVPSNNKVTKNLFAVKTKINTIKVDSSDDEMNVIIQDGDIPINIDQDSNNNDMQIDDD